MPTVLQIVQTALLKTNEKKKEINPQTDAIPAICHTMASPIDVSLCEFESDRRENIIKKKPNLYTHNGALDLNDDIAMQSDGKWR